MFFIGKNFVVGCQGASLGRKPTNDIVLSISVPVRSLCVCMCICEKLGERGSFRLSEIKDNVFSFIICCYFIKFHWNNYVLLLLLLFIIKKFSLLLIIYYELQNESGQGDEEREAVMNIDTAISSDHARIEMDPSTGLKPSLSFFFIFVNRLFLC